MCVFSYTYMRIDVRIRAIAPRSFGNIQMEEGEQWFRRKGVLTLSAAIPGLRGRF